MLRAHSVINRLGSPLTLALLLAAIALPLRAQSTLPAELREKIDAAANEALARSGVPSASITVVRDGQIAYVQAYGDARLDPKTPAQPSMRYSIGSISKQFTAAAMLLLQEQGKLSLNDRVSRFLPTLTRANEVTIRELLSHTSGYQDYWPQDYVPPFMLQPITADRIAELWAKKPLDFEPGSKWQYSNTNFVIAGMIIEKVSGMPLLRFLQEKVFTPLHMQGVANIDQARLGDTDPIGYMRFALGPLRPAPKEGKGWLFAAGELAMPAEELARWDLSIINRSLLRPASYKEFGTETLLTSGVGTHYGLGVDVRMNRGHRALSHGGEVSGFTAQNVVFPDERAAIVVLTNQDAAGASGDIADAITQLIFSTGDDPAIATQLGKAKGIFDGLQRGTVDPSLFTDNLRAYFSPQAVQDFATGLAPLGAPKEFVQTYQALRGGMTLRVYRVAFGEKTLRVWTYEMPDGKLEQYQVATAE
ncbi:MAG: serine hydrolase domain-containing protein [Gemmatimonadota bacterium]